MFLELGGCVMENKVKKINSFYLKMICILAILCFLYIFGIKIQVYAADYKINETEIIWVGDKIGIYYQYTNYEDGVWIVRCQPCYNVTSEEDDDFYYSDERFKWIIPDEIAGKKVIGIGKLEGCSTYYSYPENNVMDIVFPQSLKYIGKKSFENCKSVKEISIPNSVKYIGEGAFGGCSGLTSITIPDGVTSIGDYAFSNCNKIEMVYLNEGLQEIGWHAFDGCRSLKSINIPKSVKDIGRYAFADCRAMMSYDVEEGNQEYFSVDGMLCEHRTDWVDSEEIYYDEDDDEYYHKTIEVPVTYILQYPAGKKGKFSIEKDMLLEGAALMNALGIEEYEVDVDNRYYSSEDGVLLNKDKTDLKYVPCSKIGEYKVPETVTIINFSAFSNSSLSKVIIPDSVVELGNYAFYQCSKLESVSIGKGLKSIDFGTCENLKEISISADNSKYVSLNNVVYDKKLETLVFCPRGYEGRLTLPDTVKKCSYSAFESQDIDDNNYKCNGITELYLGEKFNNAIEEDDEDEESIENNLFFPYSLQNIYVSSKNTDYQSVDGVLYSKDMKNLIMIPPAKEKVEIPDGVVNLISGCCDDTLNTGKSEDGSTYYFSTQRNKSIRIPRSVKMISYGVYPEIIYGYTGSVAETYAKDNNIKFESIGKVDDTKQTENTEKENNTQQAIHQNYTTDQSTGTQQQTTSATQSQNSTNQTLQPVSNNDNSVNAPAKVKGLSAKNKKGKKINVTWKWQDEVDKYEIQYALNKKFTKSKKVKMVAGYNDSATISKLKKGKTYYVRIRAYRNSVGGKVYSGWSTVKKVKVKK